MSGERSVADEYVTLLAERGIEYLFGNAGTDFPPIIEALARAAEEGRRVPVPFVVPHENVAVAMAHGHYMISGRMQAVMVHVGLGTANGINGLFNAARQNVPMLFTAGRTPITEGGPLGARNNYIHWAQEMFDQAAMVREIVKWEYELRHPAQLTTVVDRALAVALSEPRGPVYLTLPREVLAEPAAPRAHAGETSSLAPASVTLADPAALAALAEALGAARRPLIVTANLGRNAHETEALGRLAEALAIPVVQYRPRYVCLPRSHAMHAGFDPHPWLAESDLVLVIECDVPWIPDQAKIRPGTRVAQIGADPLFARYPIRGFRADWSIAGAAVPALRTLRELTHADAAAVSERRGEIELRRGQMRAAWSAARDHAAREPEITPVHLTACLDGVKPDDAIVINEYPLALEHFGLEHPGTFFAHSPSGGLGWALGAALGAKIAAPDRLVIAAVGDGAYMFGNPVAAHQVSRAAGLPFLTVILNNAMWMAVQRSTLAMYPKGYASRANQPVMSSLSPSPDFEKVIESCGGYGERVERPGDLVPALKRAIDVVRNERRQALLNVICRPVVERTS
ncbi:MAG TPA: thiamine pyrophosphate-requiring protein [Candidatus Cybelea sp.]|nr:thiamine pyrophosphate-requiring protein [Candidatus Cybelea sp.]